MTTDRRLQRWLRAQDRERAFWLGFFRERGGLDEVHRRLDYAYQAVFLERLVGWVGINLPDTDVVDVGCGPCGLAPWVRARRRFGLDPLADWFRAQGVRYTELGYETVVAQPIEGLPIALRTFGVEARDVGMIVCCNMLDHVADVSAALEQLSSVGRRGSGLFLSYDVRHKATDLHPSLTSADLVASLLTAAGWRLRNWDEGAPTHDSEAISCRRFEHWSRDRKGGAQPVLLTRSVSHHTAHRLTVRRS